MAPQKRDGKQKPFPKDKVGFLIEGAGSSTLRRSAVLVQQWFFWSAAMRNSLWLLYKTWRTVNRCHFEWDLLLKTELSWELRIVHHHKSRRLNLTWHNLRVSKRQLWEAVVESGRARHWQAKKCRLQDSLFRQWNAYPWISGSRSHQLRIILEFGSLCLRSAGGTISRPIYLPFTAVESENSKVYPSQMVINTQKVLKVQRQSLSLTDLSAVVASHIPKVF